MKSILLIEDAPEYQLMVKKALSNAEIDLVIAETTEAGRKSLSERQFDLILLDLVLPDGGGLEFMGALQENARYSSIPVMFLTGTEDVGTKVAAFSLGAEDYLTKPFNPLELRARIEAKLKRQKRTQAQVEFVSIGEIQVHLAEQRVYSLEGGTKKELALTGREFKILAYLARHPERVFSRDQILGAVWGENIHILDRTVDTHICALRKKLGTLGSYIESLPGSGYRLTSANRVRAKFKPEAA
jgi:DNA-binding response OmpR family regulator